MYTNVNDKKASIKAISCMYKEIISRKKKASFRSWVTKIKAVTPVSVMFSHFFLFWFPLSLQQISFQRSNVRSSCDCDHIAMQKYGDFCKGLKL
jgi:hypothetical protein